MDKISFDTWSNAQLWDAHADMLSDGDLDGAAQLARFIRARQPVDTFHFFPTDDIVFVR